MYFLPNCWFVDKFIDFQGGMGRGGGGGGAWGLRWSFSELFPGIFTILPRAYSRPASGMQIQSYIHIQLPPPGFSAHRGFTKMSRLSSNFPDPFLKLLISSQKNYSTSASPSCRPSSTSSPPN